MRKLLPPPLLALGFILSLPFGAAAQVPAGGLDTTWIGGGKKLVSASNATVLNPKMIVDANGAAFLVSTVHGTTSPFSDKTMVCKLLPTGSLDTTFNSSGAIVLTGFDSTDSGKSVALQSTGKLLVASVASASKTIVIRRLTTAGILDTTFGTIAQSYGATQVFASVPEIHAIKALADDSFLVLAAAQASGGSVTSLHLLHFTASGAKDAAFNNDTGVAQLPASVVSSVKPLLLDTLSDGRIRAVAVTLDAAPSVIVAQFTSAGLPDTTFGTQGIVASPSIPAFASVAAALVNANGKVLLAGKGSTNHLVLARLNANATLDTTFATNGVATATVGTDSDSPYGLYQRADGRIFVADLITSSAVPSFGLVRFRPDGTLDAAFDTDGSISTAMGLGSDTVNDLAVGQDGRLYVCGTCLYTAANSNSAFAVARYNPGPAETNTAPVIATAPTSLTVNRKSSATFTVAAQPGNVLTPWYIWRKGTAIIPNATGPTLTIVSAELTDEGTYSVEVGNEGGSVTVGSLVLTVKAPPVITFLLVDTPLPRGELGNLTVVVVGREPFTFQWHQGSRSVGAGSITNGKESDLLVVGDSSFVGTYTVTITNDDGSVTSDPVTLSVANNPPSITTISDSVTVPASATEMTNVIVDSAGWLPQTVQWLKNGKPYGAPHTQDTHTEVLTLANTASNAGTYQCKLTNPDGTATSNPFTLKVVPDPSFLLDARRFLLSEGNSLSLGGKVYTANSSPTFQWQFNGKNITDEVDTTYILLGMTFANAGSYRMVASIPGKTAYDTASVAVVENTRRSVYGAVNKPVSITAKAVGDGFTYLWSRVDGTPLVAPHCRGMNTATLTIAAGIVGVDEGDYVCTVGRSGVNNTVDTAAITLVIETARPSLDGVALPDGTLGEPYDYTVPATNDATHFTITGLPLGLTYDAKTGSITGASKVAGTFQVKITAANVVGSSATTAFPLFIDGIPLKYVGNNVALLNYGAFNTYGVITLALNASGGFSGKVSVANYAAGISAVSFTGTIARPAPGDTSKASSTEFNLPPVIKGNSSIRYTLDLTMGSADTIECVMTPIANPLEPSINVTFYHTSWNSTTNRSPYLGYYTNSITRRTASTIWFASGSGYASFTGTVTGAFTFAGKMPDGTAFASPAYFNDTGTAVVHTWLYGNKGELSGTITCTAPTAPTAIDGTVTGDLHWQRPASTLYLVQPITSDYFNGIDNQCTVGGNNYIKPSATAITGPYMMGAASGADNIKVRLSSFFYPGGTNPLAATLTTSHTVVFHPPAAGSPVTYHSLVFNPTTGVFSGSATQRAYDFSTGGFGLTVTSSFQGIVVLSSDSSTGTGIGYYNFPYTYKITGVPATKVLQYVPILVSGGAEITLN